MSDDQKSSKDVWDKLSSLSTVLATLVLGTLGFYYTHVVEQRQQRAEHAQDLQLEQDKAQFTVETQHWNEAETTREEEWKEQQGRLTAQDLRTDELFKQTQDQNSQLQMFTQMWAYLGDKDEATQQRYLAALQPLVGRPLATAAQMMIHAKQAGNTAIAAVENATTPAAQQIAVNTLSGALSLGNSLAANAPVFPTGVIPNSIGIGSAPVTLPDSFQTYPFGQPYTPLSTGSGLSDNILLPQILGSSPSSLGDPATSQSLTLLGLGTPSTIDVLADIGQEVNLSMKLGDSVVRIISGVGNDFREGSGFFVDSNGLILTVASALSQSTQSVITVICNDNSSVTARIVWREDTPEGLALIRVERASTPISNADVSLPPQKVFIVSRTSKVGALATRGSVSAWGTSNFDVFGLTLFGFQGSPVVDQGGGLLGVLLNDSPMTATSKCKRFRVEDALKHSK